MGQQKNALTQAIVITVLLVITLPLTYLFVSRVLLPLEWHEPEVQESISDSQ